MAGILLVHGGDDQARRVFAEEAVGYWSAAAGAVLEKHGFLAVDDAGPEALEDRDRLTAADAVLVARLPEEAWTPVAVATVLGVETTTIVEGPLPAALAERLGITRLRPLRPGTVICRDARVSVLARRYGLGVGGRIEPAATVVAENRRPDLHWSHARDIPLQLPQASAWAAPAWQGDAWRVTNRAADTLAEWREGDGEAARTFPAMVRVGPVVACAFGLLAHLGHRHTAEPLWMGEWRMAGRTGGLEALLLGLLDLAHAERGRPRWRVRPWPAGVRWVRSVRHDYDRPLTPEHVRQVVQRHDAEGSAATWYWRARHADPAQVAPVAAHPRHEVALHTELVWFGGEREREAVEAAAGHPVAGVSAHGAYDAFRFQGAPNVLWAERAGLAYSELVSRSHLHPHRFPALEPDGRIRIGTLICQPKHLSLDRSTAPGDTLAQQVLEATERAIQAGGVAQVMNHPDIHLDELFATLAAMPAEGRADWTALEIATWWRASHCRDRLALEPADDGEAVVVRAGADVEDLVLEALMPDGEVREAVVTLAAGGETRTVADASAPPVAATHGHAQLRGPVEDDR